MLGLALLAWGMPCLADAQHIDYADIERWLRSEQIDKAQQRLGVLRAQRPQDVQLRFFEGLAQQLQGQTLVARQTFLALTQEYPELAEPYNNLAVLYAATGELGLAKQALETALRIDPQYRTALQNLGDVYARLAQQVWEQARALDPKNEGLQRRLQHLGLSNAIAPSD